MTLVISSISAKQSLNFRIFIKQSSCHLIGLCSNIIYDLFIVERLYEDQSQIVSTQFFYLSVITCIFKIVNQSIHQTKLYSCYIWFVYKSRIEPLFNISIISSFTRYIYRLVIKLSSSSKGKSSQSAFWGLLTYIQLSNYNSFKLTFNLSTILSGKRFIGRFVDNFC